MPRNTVKRPSPDLDLSATLRPVDQLPGQISSQTLFGNHRPLELEVGSGKGLFLSTASMEHPDHNFVGIEIVDKVAAHAAGRLARQGITNAVVIAGDAQRIVADRVADGTIDALHIYFPDPWWKKRHRKRRVVNEASIPQFSRSLRAGGQVHFWTDVLDYFEQTVELIAALAPEFGVPIPEQELEATHDLDYRTHFERRSRQNQIPVYRVRYEKR